MMIKTILFPIILFSCLFTNSQSYFEGEVLFKVEYKMINAQIPKDYFIREVGDAYKAYVKEDKYMLIRNSQGDLGWTKSIVRLDEGYNYIEYEKSDTILKFSLSESKHKLIDFKLDNENTKVVLGETCSSVSVSYTSYDFEDEPMKVQGTYYFSPKYKLNPEKYKDYNSSFWNLYAEKAKAISIRNETTYEGQFTAISIATNITKKEVPEELFYLDKSKIIKEEN